MDEVVLIVGSWYSRCGACGKNADPYEKSHDMTRMEGDGCGAVFTHVQDEHIGIPGSDERMQQMRPDLTLIPAFKFEVPK